MCINKTVAARLELSSYIYITKSPWFGVCSKDGEIIINDPTIHSDYCHPDKISLQKRLNPRCAEDFEYRGVCEGYHPKAISHDDARDCAAHFTVCPIT